MNFTRALGEPEKMSRTKMLIINVSYWLSTVLVFILIGFVLLGSNEPVFSDAMLPYTQKELATIWLGVACIPSLVVSLIKYRKSTKATWARLLLMVPSIASVLCFCVFIMVSVLGI